MSRRRKRNARRYPVVVYLTEEEKEKLKETAIKRDVTMSDFVRRLVLEAFYVGD